MGNSPEDPAAPRAGMLHLRPEEVESLIRAVHEFSKDGKPGDDVTVAVIRHD